MEQDQVGDEPLDKKKKTKHTLLNKKSKKYKKLISKFANEKDDEEQFRDQERKATSKKPKMAADQDKVIQQKQLDGEQIQQVLQIQEQIENNNKSKNQLKKKRPARKADPEIAAEAEEEEDDERDNNEEDENEGDANSADENDEKQTVSMQSVFQNILSHEVKKQFEKNPILSEHTRPLKKVKTELKKQKQNSIKQ